MDRNPILGSFDPILARFRLFQPHPPDYSEDQDIDTFMLLL
jgi:hypothetical protein